MPNVSLNNCRIEINFYGDACADGFDEAEISDALADAANALRAGETDEEAEEAEESNVAENGEANAPEDGSENGKKTTKLNIAGISELVRRAATGAPEKRDGV